MADLFGTEEIEIKIKVITIDGKRVSRSFLNQILPEDIADFKRKKEPENSFLLDMEIHGKPLGWVRIEATGYPTKHILIWEKNGKLRKCEHRYRTFEEWQGQLSQEQYDQLLPIYNAPHLFMGA